MHQQGSGRRSEELPEEYRAVVLPPIASPGDESEERTGKETQTLEYDEGGRRKLHMHNKTLSLDLDL